MIVYIFIRKFTLVVQIRIVATYLQMRTSMLNVLSLSFFNQKRKQKAFPSYLFGEDSFSDILVIHRINTCISLVVFSSYLSSSSRLVFQAFQGFANKTIVIIAMEKNSGGEPLHAFKLTIICPFR